MKKAKKTQEDPSSPETKELTSVEGPPLSVKNDDHESGLPIDRGYAWVIVFACMFINMICLGLQRAYGILFVEFLELFQMPVGVTSLVMAIQATFASLSALLTQTVMLSLLSERQTMVIGAICGAVGLIFSYFATSLFHLILTHSVLMGTANGMIMGPTMVIVGKYFHKRRSFAMAVAILGGNLGAMTMPPFTEALLDTFGTRGTLLVLGSIFLNIMVFAGLLRPLVPRRRLSPRKTARPEDEGQPSAHHNVWYRGKDAHHLSVSMHSLGPTMHMARNPRLCMSMPELFIAAEILVTADDNDDGVDSDNDWEQNHELEPLKKDNRTSTSEKSKLTSEKSKPGSEKSKLHGDLQPQHTASNKIGNSGNNSSSRTRPNNNPNQEPRHKKGGLCSRVLAMFDFSLFKQPPFLLVTFSASLGILPAALFGMYLPAMAAGKGVTGQRAALLLTVFGGCGIASRLGFGYLADLNLIRRAHLMAVLAFLSCTAGLFAPVYSTFNLLLVFSITYGLFGIVFFSLLPVVVVDLMGLANMSKTLGFVQLFQGAFMAAAHPVIGSLRDLTGDYHASFYFLSGAGLASGILLLFTPLVMRPEPSPLELSRKVSIPHR